MDTFLENPTREQLEQAVAWNHRELFVREALASGGEARQSEGVTWTYAGPKGDAMILFPRLSEATAGEQLDAIVAYYRERRPESLVGCWSLYPSQPADLEVRLLARGFQLGWQPRWMWLDLQKINTDHPRSDGLSVELLVDEEVWDVKDLPYYEPEKVATDRAETEAQLRRKWRFGAWLDGKIVGHSTLFVTTGPLGVAGIYGVGVVPAARNQGIGKAVTLAACQYARHLGCRHALLNATGERMYRQLGFATIGYGRTWWLNVARLEAQLPTPERIALAEAVGRGDRPALETFAGSVSATDLDTPLPSGMTLLQVAVHTGQAASAEWLVEQGAALDIVSAWELGWKARVPQLLAENPALANQRLGAMQTTPLHIAIERNDLELARIVLAAHPDLESKDAVFHSTPLGWAKHFQRAEILALIQEALTPDPSPSSRRGESL